MSTTEPRCLRCNMAGESLKYQCIAGLFHDFAPPAPAASAAEGNGWCRANRHTALGGEPCACVSPAPQAASTDAAAEISLTRGFVAKVDAADFEVLTRWKWHVSRGSSGPCYATRSEWLGKGKSRPVVRMHRFILALTDPTIKVDHKNGNGLDNRRENLRIATPQENSRNVVKQPGTTSRFKGVSLHRDKKQWQAQIRYAGRIHYLGLHPSEELAASAYDDAARRFFGEFARLNLVRGI